LVSFYRNPIQVQIKQKENKKKHSTKQSNLSPIDPSESRKKQLNKNHEAGEKCTCLLHTVQLNGRLARLETV
jgi:uncharacterized membrane protein YgaE (UPF0421/DUF939 family)